MKKMPWMLLYAIALAITVPTVSYASGLFYVDDNGNIGIGNTDPQQKLDISGAEYSRMISLTDAGTVGVDWDDGNVQMLTLDRGNTNITFQHGRAGGKYTLVINQDATGGRGVTWPPFLRWPGGTAPTISSSADSTDVINFLYDGTNYLGSFDLDYGIGGAGIVVGNTQVISTCSATSTCTATYDVLAGNQAAIFFVETDQNTTVTATCNSGSTSMTSAGSGVLIFSSPDRYAWLFSSDSCPSGTQDFTATLASGTGSIETNVISYTGVGTIGSSQSSTGNGSINFSLTAGPNDWIVGNVNGKSNVSGGTGVTNYYSGGGGPGFGDSGLIASPGSYSMTFNVASGFAGGGWAIDLKP